MLVGKFFLFSSAIVVLTSCAKKRSNTNLVSGQIYLSLVSSGEIIHQSNNLYFNSVKDKMVSPVTVEKARLIYPYVQRVKTISDSAIAKLDKIIVTFFKKIDLKNKDTTYEGPNFEITTDFLATKNGKEDLYNCIKFFTDSVFKNDSSLNEIYASDYRIAPGKYRGEVTPYTDVKAIFENNNYTELTSGELLSVLISFRNNILNTTNRILRYYDNKIRSLDRDIYWSFSALIGINSSYVKPGEKIELSAGVGQFNNDPNFEYFINNKKVIPENGLALYEINSPATTGKYSIPVRINYTDPIDGKKKTFEKNIYYTVAQ